MFKFKIEVKGCIFYLYQSWWRKIQQHYWQINLNHGHKLTLFLNFMYFNVINYFIQT